MFAKFVLVSLLGFIFLFSVTKGFPWLELSNIIQRETSNSSCHCENYDCGCCAYLHIPKIKLNDTVCANLTYLPHEYGFCFTFSIDGKVYYNETISARNPPPVCFGVPYLEKYASICIRFYDLDVELPKIHGCIELEAHLEHIVVGKYDLGCFNFGKIGKQIRISESSLLNDGTIKVDFI